jgi:hypothetical protein
VDNEEKRQAVIKATQELLRELDTLKRMFAYAVNGLAPMEALTKGIQRYQEKRQSLNNLNQGMLIGVSRFNIELFPLTGDPKKDGGQKNLSNPDSPDTNQNS